MDDSSDFLIRCRLTDEIHAAVEFSARDAQTLGAECERAYSRYVRRFGRSYDGSLVLQVRPVRDTQIAGGWWCPVRRRVQWRVSVSPEILDRRSHDGWVEIWLAVVAARGADRRLGAFVDSATDNVFTEEF